MHGAPKHLIDANNFCKELNEAIDVCKKIEDQISWACDFTSFTNINNILEPIYDAVDTAQEQLVCQLERINEQIEDHYLKLYQFDNENAIEL